MGVRIWVLGVRIQESEKVSVLWFLVIVAVVFSLLVATPGDAGVPRAGAWASCPRHARRRDASETAGKMPPLHRTVGHERKTFGRGTGTLAGAGARPPWAVELGTARSGCATSARCRRFHGREL